MAPSQRTRLALFKKKEATRNKEILNISDDEGMKDYESPKGWNKNFSYQESPQELSKNFCDICTKEIAKGEVTCDMCYVMESYAKNCELFGYNLNAPASPTEEWVQSALNSHMITSPEPGRKYFAFCFLRLENI